MKKKIIKEKKDFENAFILAFGRRTWYRKVDKNEKPLSNYIKPKQRNFKIKEARIKLFNGDLTGNSVLDYEKQ